MLGWTAKAKIFGIIKSNFELIYFILFKFNIDKRCNDRSRKTNYHYKFNKFMFKLQAVQFFAYLSV